MSKEPASSTRHQASGIRHQASALPPIKGFLETSLLDWPGHVCAVAFLPYCNLRCPYCHNHQLVLKPDALETLSLEAILEQLTPQRDWIDGVCVTGGEPTIHRGLPDLLEKIHEVGLKTKLDTNGTQPETLRHLISRNLVDHVAMDVKAPLNDATYERCAGVYVPTSIIKNSIEVLMATGIPSTFRCTVTPNLLSENEICGLAEELKDLQREVRSDVIPSLKLQNFNPADPMDPALKDVNPFDETTLSRMQDKVDRIFGLATDTH